MPLFHVTVRYGGSRIRYHTFEVEAANVAEALRRASEDVPDEVSASADIAEIRRAPDPEKRAGG